MVLMNEDEGEGGVCRQFDFASNLSTKKCNIWLRHCCKTLL